jgi:hypothetical protein
VPHHPHTGGDVTEPIARPDIALQKVLFPVLNEGSDCSMDDAVRVSGGTGAVENIYRVLSRHPDIIEFLPTFIGIGLSYEVFRISKSLSVWSTS